LEFGYANKVFRYRGKEALKKLTQHSHFAVSMYAKMILAAKDPTSTYAKKVKKEFEAELKNKNRPREWSEWLTHFASERDYLAFLGRYSPPPKEEGELDVQKVASQLKKEAKMRSFSGDLLKLNLQRGDVWITSNFLGDARVEEFVRVSSQLTPQDRNLVGQQLFQTSNFISDSLIEIAQRDRNKKNQPPVVDPVLPSVQLESTASASLRNALKIAKTPPAPKKEPEPVEVLLFNERKRDEEEGVQIYVLGPKPVSDADEVIRKSILTEVRGAWVKTLSKLKIRTGQTEMGRAPHHQILEIISRLEAGDILNTEEVRTSLRSIKASHLRWKQVVKQKPRSQAPPRLLADDYEDQVVASVDKLLELKWEPSKKTCQEYLRSLPENITVVLPR